MHPLGISLRNGSRAGLGGQVAYSWRMMRDEVTNPADQVGFSFHSESL
jgi:hypothetical protein